MDSKMMVMPVTSTISAEWCVVCGLPAYGFNYGVLCCSACKMFFRRIEVEQIKYSCRNRNKCFEDKQFISALKSSAKCRACRYQKCLKVGMKYISPAKLELDLVNRKDDIYCANIGNLLTMDFKRCHKIMYCYTEEDPTILEMVTRSKGSRMFLKDASQKVELNEWSFLGMYASVELFLSFDFMDQINLNDKVLLLRNFSMKSMLFTGGMRSLMADLERVMTPDGQDVYPDYMYTLPFFSVDFLNGIRCRLVARLRELKVTSEEHVLLNATLFCDPALSFEDPATKNIIASRQKTYSSALLQYCFITYQQSGPSRFTDLLSICHVINRQSSLLILFQLHLPQIRYKKLYDDVCHK